MLAIVRIKIGSISIPEVKAPRNEVNYTSLMHTVGVGCRLNCSFEMSYLHPTKGTLPLIDDSTVRQSLVSTIDQGHDALDIFIVRTDFKVDYFLSKSLYASSKENKFEKIDPANDQPWHVAGLPSRLRNQEVEERLHVQNEAFNNKKSSQDIMRQKFSGLANKNLQSFGIPPSYQNSFYKKDPSVSVPESTPALRHKYTKGTLNGFTKPAATNDSFDDLFGSSAPSPRQNSYNNNKGDFQKKPSCIKPAPINDSFDDLFGSSEPAPRQNSYNNNKGDFQKKPSYSKPAATNDSFDDLFCSSEPALRQNSYNNNKGDFQKKPSYSKPALINDSFDDLFGSSEPAPRQNSYNNNKGDFQKKPSYSKPAPSNDSFDDLFGFSKPAPRQNSYNSKNSTGDDFQKKSSFTKPAATNDSFDDLFCSSKPALRQNLYNNNKGGNFQKKPYENKISYTKATGSNESFDDLFGSSEPAPRQNSYNNNKCGDYQKKPYENKTSHTKATGSNDSYGSTAPAARQNSYNNNNNQGGGDYQKKPYDNKPNYSKQAASNGSFDDLFGTSEPAPRQNSYNGNYQGGGDYQKKPHDYKPNYSKPAASNDSFDDLFGSSEPAPRQNSYNNNKCGDYQKKLYENKASHTKATGSNDSFGSSAPAVRQNSYNNNQGGDYQKKPYDNKPNYSKPAAFNDSFDDLFGSSEPAPRQNSYNSNKKGGDFQKKPYENKASHTKATGSNDSFGSSAPAVRQNSCNNNQGGDYQKKPYDDKSANINFSEDRSNDNVFNPRFSSAHYNSHVLDAHVERKPFDKFNPNNVKTSSFVTRQDYETSETSFLDEIDLSRFSLEDILGYNEKTSLSSRHINPAKVMPVINDLTSKFSKTTRSNTPIISNHQSDNNFAIEKFDLNCMGLSSLIGPDGAKPRVNAKSTSVKKQAVTNSMYDFGMDLDSLDLGSLLGGDNSSAVDNSRTASQTPKNTTKRTIVNVSAPAPVFTSNYSNCNDENTILASYKKPTKPITSMEPRHTQGHFIGEMDLDSLMTQFDSVFASSTPAPASNQRANAPTKETAKQVQQIVTRPATDMSILDDFESLDLISLLTGLSVPPSKSSIKSNAATSRPKEQAHVATTPQTKNMPNIKYGEFEDLKIRFDPKKYQNVVNSYRTSSSINFRT